MSEYRESLNYPIIHIASIKIWKYKGWLFEFDENKPFGPWPLKKDYSPRKRAGTVFWGIFEQFMSETPYQRSFYRITNNVR